MKYIIDGPKAWIARFEGDRLGASKFAEFVGKSRRPEKNDWEFRVEDDGIYRTSENATFIIVSGKYHDITKEIPDLGDYMRESRCDFQAGKEGLWDLMKDIYMSQGGNIWWNEPEP